MRRPAVHLAERLLQPTRAGTVLLGSVHTWVQQMRAIAVAVYDFFARKTKIIVLTILTYAALC